jgi:hypothetical protein
MHKMTFYPLGNADCCRLDTEGGRKILFDYADVRDPKDKWDLRCDLPEELRADLEAADRDFYDVVAFTHLDRDHFAGFSSFFHLEHAAKYQGGDRVKIGALWVPAAMITETAPDDDEAKILQKEARHRLKQGAGIRVFSRPEALKEWCESNGVDFKKRRHLITDAGQLAPEFSLSKDGIEFFIHSPFMARQDDNTVVDRNGNALVVQVAFRVGDTDTKALLLADCHWDALVDIVKVTLRKQNQCRLEWDIARLPHHCSYLSLSEERGKEKTKPAAEVATLYERYGQSGAIMVATCSPVPEKGAQDDNDQPPHRQAAAYYEEAAAELDGQFVVTMAHPTKSAPKPVVIEIGKRKGTLKKDAATVGTVATSQRAPRAGRADG